MSRDGNSLFVLAISETIYLQEGLEGNQTSSLLIANFFIEYQIME